MQSKKLEKELMLKLKIIFRFFFYDCVHLKKKITSLSPSWLDLV